MFLLVAHTGSPGQRAVKWLLLLLFSANFSSQLLYFFVIIGNDDNVYNDIYIYNAVSIIREYVFYSTQMDKVICSEK